MALSSVSRVSRICTALLLVFATTAATPERAAAASVAERAPLPPSLRNVVRGARHRPVQDLMLGGRAFHAMSRAEGTAYLLWPAPARPESAAGAAGGPPYHAVEAGDWLREHGAALGLAGMEPRFAEVFSWIGNEVWEYRLAHLGIAIHDARVLLHWQGDTLVGIVNDVPLPVLEFEPAAADASAIATLRYLARREGAGFRMGLAREEVRTVEGRTERLLSAGGVVRRRIVEAQPAPASALLASFREWPVAAGNFPDQIDIDRSGIVWFSQPNSSAVTSLDPATGLFNQYPTTGGNSPDGMLVDRSDILWTGMYDGSTGLGRFDTTSKVFSLHGAPYASPVLAVPTETSRDTIWMTDHATNKISEYDPGTSTWLQSTDVPSPSAWVVSGTEHPATQDVYFTEYNVDKLLLKPLAGPMSEIATPAGGGPAFDVYHNGKVYFSQWARARLGEYDIATGLITEYAYPVNNEPGGPIDVTPGGLVAVGTLNQGYVMVFDPVTTTVASYPVPTVTPGFKDGLRSDAVGAIWFTESGANKIGVLELCAAPPPVLGNVLLAIREGAGGARLRWSDDPVADGYEAAAAETRDLNPLVAIGLAASGNPGLLDALPLGASGIRGYRVASTLCGVRSSF